MTSTDQDSQSPAPQAPSRRYSNYVLGVLVLVYVFNFIDRQILSILAEDIRNDLGVSDAQLGFLYGTAFAVFYAIFGIPIGRLADMWTRKSLISIGLAAWSLMTALSGTARGFASLAAYRVGVGIGESSAGPAAFSMLGDYYPPRLRATVTAMYSSGVYIGAGLGILIGGQIVDRWNNAYADGGAPFGLVGWQVAFFAVGLPGLLMAIWVWTLKEPVRGQSEGIVTPSHPAPFKELGKETAAIPAAADPALAPAQRRQQDGRPQPPDRGRMRRSHSRPDPGLRQPGAVDRSRYRRLRLPVLGAGPEVEGQPRSS